jgi:hypothetical protein
MGVMVVDKSNAAGPGGPAHTHDTETRVATCPACRLEEARADLNRAQQRLRRLHDEAASGRDPAGD